MNNRDIIRWYIAVYPTASKGLKGGLESELMRRKLCGEPLFEYFAPTFVETKEVSGRLVKTEKPLLFNYLFIRSSEAEIFKIKKNCPKYNLLSRVKGSDSKQDHYPYISDLEMECFRWIAKSYDGVVPMFVADARWLVKGDRVRITDGRFAGLEATVVGKKRSSKTEFIVSVDNMVWIPLLNVQRGQYELIELCDSGSGRYSKLGNDRTSLKLHEALCRKLRGDGTQEDVKLAQMAIKEFANLEIDSKVLRCKQYAIMLMAYKITDDNDGLNGLIGLINSIRIRNNIVKMEVPRALVLITLYGCTNSSIWHDLAHEVTDQWMSEDSPKKAKLQLLKRLADYDECLGH